MGRCCTGRWLHGVVGDVQAPERCAVGPPAAGLVDQQREWVQQLPDNETTTYPARQVAIVIASAFSWVGFWHVAFLLLIWPLPLCCVPPCYGMVWCGVMWCAHCVTLCLGRQHVFIITVKAAVWRSKNGGSTFEDISDRFKSECCKCRHARVVMSGLPPAAASKIENRQGCKTNWSSRLDRHPMWSEH